MIEHVSDKPGPTLRAQWLGQQLRELRNAAGSTLKQAGAYLQRTDGDWQPDVSKPDATAFPTTGARILTSPTPLLASRPEYTYTATDTVGGNDGLSRVQFDFLVVPSNPTESAPAGQVVTQAAGIFIRKITWTDAKGDDAPPRCSIVSIWLTRLGRGPPPTPAACGVGSISR